MVRGRKPELKHPVPFRMVMDMEMKEHLLKLERETNVSMSKLVRDAIGDKYPLDMNPEDLVQREIPTVTRRALRTLRFIAPLADPPTNSLRVHRSNLSLVLNTTRWDDMVLAINNAAALLEMKKVYCIVDIDMDGPIRRGFFIRFMESEVYIDDIIRVADDVEAEYLNTGAI